ncbi:MAG: hypothetical protein WCC03_07575 [Candidatus Acidiferrales bacterium]
MNRMQAEEKARMALYLNENGCPVQLESNHRVISQGLVIKQVPLPLVNKVFDLESGAADYLLDAHLISNLTRPICIEGVQIKPPWEGSSISLLEDDPRERANGGFYRFPESTLAFQGSEVLNGLLSGRCKLKPRDDPEGLIMAIDTQPIPDDVSDRERIDVKLTVFDGAGNGFSSDFRLCVDRSAIRARQRKEEMRAYFQSPSTRKRTLIPT